MTLLFTKSQKYV